MTKPLRQTLRTADDIVAAGLVPRERAAELAQVARRYAVAISADVARLIDPDDPDDPIRRQFVPDGRELQHDETERADPIGDEAHSPVRGIVHRYPDRVLLKIASVCPVYCRFCFRREMVGPEHGQPLSAMEIEAALAYIRDRPEIWEVILTGGDPFVLSARRIAEVTARLAEIEHLKVLRWHTRVPVVQPALVTDGLVAALRADGASVWVAVHANHPRELTADARAAFARLSRGGVQLVSQTVLLRGVNDDVATLAALMRGFVEAGVKPYYLHHADLAPGTAHLRTTIAEGQALMQALRGHVSGLAQPIYILDIPGGHGKVPVGPNYVARGDGDDALVVTDPNGRRHRY